MEFFIYDNKIEVNDGQHGWAIVKFEGFKVFVNAMVVSQDSPNYCDILAVGEAITSYAKTIKGKVSIEEAYNALIEKFGASKVICEELELLLEVTKPIEYKGYVVNGKRTSYKDMRGHFLEGDKNIHVCGYEHGKILVQLEPCGEILKRSINHSSKGLYFNAKGKRVYIDYLVKSC